MFLLSNPDSPNQFSLNCLAQQVTAMLFFKSTSSPIYLGMTITFIPRRRSSSPPAPHPSCRPTTSPYRNTLHTENKFHIASLRHAPQMLRAARDVSDPGRHNNKKAACVISETCAHDDWEFPSSNHKTQTSLIISSSTFEERPRETQTHIQIKHVEFPHQQKKLEVARPKIFEYHS